MIPGIGRLRPVAARLVRRRVTDDDNDQDDRTTTTKQASRVHDPAANGNGVVAVQDHPTDKIDDDDEDDDGDDNDGGHKGDGFRRADSDGHRDDHENNDANIDDVGAGSGVDRGDNLKQQQKQQPERAAPQAGKPASSLPSIPNALHRLPVRLRSRARPSPPEHTTTTTSSSSTPHRTTTRESPAQALTLMDLQSPLAPPAASRPAPPTRVPRAAAPPKGGVVFDADHDRKLAERQRASIKFVFQRLSRDLLAGAPNIRTTSMPIHLNEPRSFLERVTDEFTYADYFLPAAVRASSNPVLRLAFIAGLLVSGLHRSATVAKVFNPHIGETYQAAFGPHGDPTLFSLEQTRHHPPVTHFVACPSDAAYTLSGYAGFDSAIRFSEQALLTRRTGISVVDFADDDSRIVFFQPQFVVRGLLGGERRVEVQGPCALYYEKYNLVLDLHFDPPQPFVIFGTRLPSDRFQGVLYELGADSSQGFCGAFAKDSRSYFGEPDELMASLSREREHGAASMLSAVGNLVVGDVKDSSLVSANKHINGVSEPNIPNGAQGSTGLVSIDGSSDINRAHGQAIGHFGKAASYVSCQDSNRDPIELRGDREIQCSVASAWQATQNGTVIDFANVDESVTMPNVSRRIIALASGSFVSHLDIGGMRIWDLDVPSCGIRPLPIDEVLPSDSRFRPDLVALQNALAVDDSTDRGRLERNELLEKAQVSKDDLENEKRRESRYRPVVENIHDGFVPKSVLDMGTR